MSASNTAHVPMDEPHLSRYGANAARALELEGAVRPGTVAREMRRALAEVERARQELARWAEESGRTPGAVEWLLDNAYLAAREDGGAGLPQGQAPATLPERPVCSPVCRPDGALGGPRPGPPPPDGLSLRVPVRTAPHRTGAVPAGPRPDLGAAVSAAWSVRGPGGAAGGADRARPL